MLHCDRCPRHNCGYIWNDQRWNPICLYGLAHSVGLVSFHHVSQLLQSSTIWLLLFQTILEDLWVEACKKLIALHLINDMISACSQFGYWAFLIAFQTILNVANSHLRCVFSFLSPLPSWCIDSCTCRFLCGFHKFQELTNINWKMLNWQMQLSAVFALAFVEWLHQFQVGCRIYAACQHRSCRARAMMCNTCSLQEVANVEHKVCSVEHKVKIKCRASKMQVKLSESWKDEWSAKFGSIAWSASTGRMEGNKCSITWSCKDKIHSGSFIIRKSM